MFTSLFKGFLLVGILLWYSIAIMTVINDYFRVEFNAYLKKQSDMPSLKKAEPPPTQFHSLSKEPAALHSNHHTDDHNNLKTVVDMLQCDGIDKMKCASANGDAVDNDDSGCDVMQLQTTCIELSNGNNGNDDNKPSTKHTVQILNSNDDIIKSCSITNGHDDDDAGDEPSICAKSNTVKWSRKTGTDFDAQAKDVHS